MSKIPAILLCGSFLSFALSNPAAPAGDKATDEVSYYLGESKMSTPDGRLVRTTLSLVKRVVSREDSRIEEHVLSIDEKNVAKPFVVVMEVKGTNFTLKERSNSFTGSGELVGEPWKWKEWKSISRSKEGTITSEDKITERGLSAKKTYAGADGKVILHFAESLERVSPKTYEILYARLVPDEKK